MTTKTCAACDDDVGPNPIKVTIGQKTVEVCCEACAQALRDAEKSKSASR
jgi:hypothetical protein